MASMQDSYVNPSEELKKCDSVEKEDYLVEYRKFFEKFADVTGSGDQLPVKVIGCLSVTENEIPGEILSYTLQYLDAIECPAGLVTPICRDVLEDTRKTLETDPNAFGKNSGSASSMSLMRSAVASVHCALRAGLDNERACRLPAPACAPVAATAASRNGRRCMEDRHVTIDDFDRLFGIQDDQLTSFYAVYDGHCGPLAASYSAAHLHLNFVNSPHYKTNPQAAMREAFIKTDASFVSKEPSGGTTAAVCYLKGNNLLVGWAGDSQALLVGDGSLIQLVRPHKPSRKDESSRIVQLGGQVTFDGIWRVNGVLAVSRAIGNLKMKPYISSEPEFASVQLSGFEEFIVLACDGLWDFVSEDEVALEVYKAIEKHPDDIKKVAEHLVHTAKIKDSFDNISVVVIFLQDPYKLAQKATWLLKKFATMDASFDNTGGAQTNRFHVNPNSQDVPFSKDGLLFELDGFKKQNGSEPEDPFFAEDRPTNGKRSSDHFEEEEDMDDEDDEDLGPETDVDAADEVQMSPSLAAARALLQVGVEGEEGAEQEPRQETETPTPLAEAEAEGETVFDAALVDNVGESGGEDSEDEDEWNYFKGDKKDDVSPQLPAADTEPPQQNLLCDLEDAMNSPLNPEAPPFVPVSPTRPEPSALPAHLLTEEVVAQSPQKPVSMDDISVPEPGDFESEVSTRLHDLGNTEEYLNGHSDFSAFMSSQENLKETLHGNEKQQGGLDFGANDNIDHVNSTVEVVNLAEFDRVQKDTTDFCDIQVAFTPHTNQAFEDEGIDEELYERLKNKERDPMSMSFYQEKDEDTSEVQHNPFDLNAVQTLPNDSDEDFSNDQPLPDNSVQAMMCGINPFMDKQGDQSDVTSHEIHAAISDLDNAVTNEPDSIDIDFHKAASPLISEKTDAELAEDVHEPTSDISQLSEPSEQEEEHKDLLCPEEVETAVSQDSAFSAEVSSPIEAEGDLCHISKHSALSPEPFEASEEYLAKSPEPVALSPEPVALSPEPLALSPEPVCISPEPVALSPEPIVISLEPALCPEPALSPEPVVLSPEPAFCPEPAALSPEPAALSPEPVAQSPVPISQSPEPRMESPEPRVLSPELRAQSPELEVEFCCEPPQGQTPEPTELLPEHLEHSSEVLALSPEPVAQSPIPLVLSPEPILSPAALSPEPQESQEVSEAYHLPVSHSPPEHKEYRAYSPEPESQEFETQEPGFIQQFGQRENMFVCNVGNDAANIFDPLEKNDDDTLLNFQAPVEQVCEFVESSVVENVKNLQEFTADEVCKPLIEAQEQVQQLLPVSEDFTPTAELTQDASFNDSNVVDYSFEAAEKEANQFIDHGSFVDEVEKSIYANESTMNVTSEKTFNDVFTGPSDDMINDIVSAPSDHFIHEEVSHDLLNGHESGPIEAAIDDIISVPTELLTNGDVKSPSEEVSAPSEDSVIAPLAISAAVATVVAATAAAVVASEDKKLPPKTKPTSAVKKAPTATKTAVSPTKPTAPKSAALSTAKKSLPLTAKPASAPIKSTLAPKLTAAKPKTALSATSPTAKPPISKTLSAPRPKLPAAAPKPAPVAEKKPLANGEVKREPIRRPVPGAAPIRATPAPKPVVLAAKPLTAPKAATPKLTAARPASAPRPAPAAAAPAKPRPTPITRAPISKPSVGAARPAPAAEKLAKETTNKQLSARPTPAPRTAISATRTDVKSTFKPLTKTTTTTTVTKTNISPIKRPASATTKSTLSKTTITKTTVKSVGKVTEKLNGSLEKSIKQDMCLNGSPLITDLPLKDSSPQQVDNSLLPIIDAAAD